MATTPAVCLDAPLNVPEYPAPRQENRPPHWPVIVIGAGPAGAATALHLARAGVPILLLDRSSFPRDTVCGCCLNRRTIDHLNQLGLTDDLRGAGARAFGRLDLHAYGRSASCALPEGQVLSRSAFDSIIVAAAVRAGATFRSALSAQLAPDHTDSLCAIDTSDGRLYASIVVIADGLRGSSLNAYPHYKPHIALGARMGIAAHLPENSDFPAGVITISCTQRGYVGLARLENKGMVCAAAIDPTWMRKIGGPVAAVQTIMLEAGGPTCALDDATWLGTGRLTQQRLKVGGHRMFIVGDAAGFVEPFTGEGICWALESAATATPFVIQAVQAWQPAHAEAWQRACARGIRQRQRLCRLISFGLRHPAVMRPAMLLLQVAPRLATPLIDSISRPATQFQDTVS